MADHKVHLLVGKVSVDGQGANITVIAGKIFKLTTDEQMDAVEAERRGICGLQMSVLVVASAPCCFAVFPAGETQIWPGDVRVVAVLPRFCLCVFGFAWNCGTKMFHNVCILFARFCHC